MLAAKILMEQGIEVTGVSFKSYFFDTDKARRAAEQLGVKFIEIDFSDEHLKMVKNPKYGYGKNMNPCIDCHAMMLKKAAEYLTPLPPPLKGGIKSPQPPFAKGGIYDFDFIATGEVLGERPMSQNLEALKIVEKAAGLKGRLVRPLSAKLLDESDPEREGKVDRSRLLDISGRSRKPQFELLKKYDIKEYENPSGGCLLTDRVFSEKLMQMLEYWSECRGSDIELLKYGRIFWLHAEAERKVLLVIGRNEKENQKLEKLAKAGDTLIDLGDEAGPTSLVRSKKSKVRIKNESKEINVQTELKMSELKLGEEKSEEEILSVAAILTGYYAAKVRGKKVKVEVKTKK